MRKKKLIIICLIIIFSLCSFSSYYFVKPVFAASSILSQINVSNNGNNAYSIKVSFSQNVPANNIIDLEVYNSSNQRVWQSFTNQGGSSYLANSSILANGTYRVAVGLFTPNWASNYEWDNSAATFTVSSVTPTPTPSSTSSANQPSVVLTPNGNNIVNVSVTLPQSVPANNIIDLEIYNSSNQKVWQSSTIKGGNNYSANTSTLANGTYRVAVGIFAPNWSSTLFWYNSVTTFSVPFSSNSTSTTPTITPIVTSPSTQPTQSIQPTVSPTSAPNSSLMSTAMNVYNSWKSTYVISANGALRVVRPENSNDTVSEGIGYGMLLSVWAGDQPTFSGLWSYAKKYLDSNGLMNWDINSSGSVIGSNGATDADQDMAYALVLANSKWPGNGYDSSAKSLINAIMKTEVNSSNVVNPGDGWGSTTTVNPSYISPAYYPAFAQMTGDTRWNDVENASNAWLLKASNSSTGLVPDWLNVDLSPATGISWDVYPSGFYYDALRTPIRMLLAYKTNQNQAAQTLLQKQAAFLSGVGCSKLVSGYTLSGQPLTSYLDTAFKSAYAAAGQANPSSSFANDSLQTLLSDNSNSYFGSTLRALSIFVIAQ
ncbi:MAG TPA: glycosyl hydrolase family 8 [Patescibacteria group bacterium]|nr:glycosyl hydrolase family 8 [Patescibacteria group bacterium]